jgi:hypothetical protein
MESEQPKPTEQVVPEHIPIYKQPIHRQAIQMHALMADEYFWPKFIGGMILGLVIGFVIGWVI